MTRSSQALRQLDQIESFCDLCDRLPMPPVTLPADAVRAAGLDPDIWHGLGIVGLWATIDAFAESTQPKKVSGRLVDRLSPELPSKLDQIAKELDDMRNLYAHNFAGVADDTYFKPQFTRNCFKASIPYTLTSGNRFDGQQLTLTLNDLKHYIQHTREILKHLDNVCLDGSSAHQSVAP